MIAGPQGPALTHLPRINPPRSIHGSNPAAAQELNTELYNGSMAEDGEDGQLTKD